MILRRVILSILLYGKHNPVMFFLCNVIFLFSSIYIWVLFFTFVFNFLDINFDNYIYVLFAYVVFMFPYFFIFSGLFLDYFVYLLLGVIDFFSGNSDQQNPELRRRRRFLDSLIYFFRSFDEDRR